MVDGVYAPTPEHIEATLDETRLLARLVEDLRTLSLAEAGQLPMRWEHVDVVELLHDVATSFSGQAEAAGVTLAVELQGLPEELSLTADYGRLDQVMGNLVANALRHTPAGGAITLSAEAEDGGVTLAVSDTGRGISPDELPHIFDRFWSRGNAGGTGGGLGLAIARSIVAAHGGSIHAESTVGLGTTMRVTFHQPAVIRVDVVVFDARARLGHHAGYGVAPRRVVGGFLVPDSILYSSVDLDQHEAGWIVCLLDHVEASDAWLEHAVARVRDGSRAEGLYRLRFDVDKYVND